MVTIGTAPIKVLYYYYYYYSGTYDARMRTLIKHIAWRLHVSVDHMEEIECEQAESITSQKYEVSE